jgi:hypothetical protein
MDLPDGLARIIPGTSGFEPPDWRLSSISDRVESHDEPFGITIIGESIAALYRIGLAWKAKIWSRLEDRLRGVMVGLVIGGLSFGPVGTIPYFGYGRFVTTRPPFLLRKRSDR